MIDSANAKFIELDVETRRQRHLQYPDDQSTPTALAKPRSSFSTFKRHVATGNIGILALRVIFLEMLVLLSWLKPKPYLQWENTVL